MPPDPDSLLLPPGTRLLYAGLPKTGTTALQAAVQAAREELYANGVCYPGTGRNHRREIFALMGRPDARRRPGGGLDARPGTGRDELTEIPPATLWDAMIAEIDAEPDRRILISHEHAAGCTPDIARRFVEELGADRTHIVLTLRPRAAILPSRWIESLKTGETNTLRRWLKRSYGIEGRPLPAATMRELDQAGVVETWAAAAGARNVTVIIVNSRDRTLLTDAFEAMLGLPDGLLRDIPLDRLTTNRSLTQPEALLLRKVNSAVYHREDMSWPVYLDVINRGAVAQLMAGRTPEADERRVALPAWALKRALADGKRDAERITAAGVRVVGDLARLYAPPAPRAGAPRSAAALPAPPQSAPLTPASPNPAQPPASIPLSIAVEALAGAFAGAEQLERAIYESVPDTEAVLNSLRSTELIAVVARRIWARLTRPFTRGDGA